MNIVSSSVCVCVSVCTIEWEETFVDLNVNTSVRIN